GTEAPSANGALQLSPQSIPAGSDVTVPAPVTPTFSVWVTATGVNVAPTLWSALMVTLQAPLPEHAPVQPEKTEPALGSGVRPTLAPSENSPVQSSGHAMPEGTDVTEPLPVMFTVKVC